MKLDSSINQFLSLTDTVFHGEALFIIWSISPKLLQSIFWLGGERNERVYAHLQKIYYNHFARVDPINAVIGSFDEQESYPYEKHLLKPLTKPFSKVVALDFGCGPGRMIKRLNGVLKRVDGVDISSNNVVSAKRYIGEIHPSPKFFVNNGYGLEPVPSNSYDFLYTTIALHHIPIRKTRINLLKEFYRVIKSGSWVSLQMVYKKKASDLPSSHHAARWWEDVYFASSTNGFYDVVISQPDLPLVKEDFENIGFRKVTFRLAPPIPRKTSPYDNWIFIYAYKT